MTWNVIIRGCVNKIRTLSQTVHRPAVRAPHRRRGEIGRQAEGGAAVGAGESAIIGHAEEHILRLAGALGLIRFADCALG